MAAFGNEMQSTYDGLTQRVVVRQRRLVSTPTHVAAGIAEKWWRLHDTDFDEFRGENLGITRVSYTWQWRCFCIVTLLKALFGYARMVIQGENLAFDLLWLDPVTTTLERRSLHEGIAVEEPRCLRGVMTWLVRIWSQL